jgi:hypothetical protein
MCSLTTDKPMIYGGVGAQLSVKQRSTHSYTCCSCMHSTHTLTLKVENLVTNSLCTALCVGLEMRTHLLMHFA